MNHGAVKWWRYENIIMVSFGLLWGLIFLDRLGITYIFPNIAADLQLTNAQLGLTMSIVAFTWGISSVIFAFISDSIGKRKNFLVFFVFMFSIATFGVGLAQSIIALLVARAIIGLAEGPSIPLIQASMMAESTPSRRGFNAGFIIAMSSLIGGLTPTLIVAIAGHLGWRYALYSMSIPGILLGIFLWIYMREPRLSNESEKDVSHVSKMKWSDVKIVLKSRNVWLCVIGAIFQMGGPILTFSSFGPLYLMKEGGFSQTAAAAIFSIYGIAQFVWSALMPWLSDRFGRKPVVLTVMFVQMLLPISFLLFHNIHGMIVLAVITFSCGSCLAPLTFFTIPGESVPPVSAATAMSLVNLVGEVIGGTLGPALGGMFADRYGIAAPIWIVLLATIVTFILFLGLKETAPAKRNFEFSKTIAQ
ncbi:MULTISPECIES: MFS transporter [Geobacillus]|uniref:MFS transporter n=1 Tax=Geobacillus zalihae TaxID=213419 RepID=A0A7H1RUS3_9BACL|nr:MULTISPECIES: MFS transporter [Geobacillus]QNU18012.1 MFS transporter [Geobacillus zalihae]